MNNSRIVPWWRRFFNSKVTLLINVALIFGVGWSLVREVSHGDSVDTQLANLEQEIASLEKQNTGYTDLIGKLGISNFVEQEARLKYGYKKPGEQTLVLREVVASDGFALSLQPDKNKTNPQKWWNYFFGVR